MPLDLNLKQAILSTIKKQSDIKLVILFGSLASGSENPESDIDLALDIGQVPADEPVVRFSHSLQKPIGLTLAFGSELLDVWRDHRRHFI